MKKSTLATTMALAASCLLPTSAQTIDSSEQPGSPAAMRPSKLDTITVLGTRTETSVQNSPASVSVIDRYEIERQAPESIAELIRDVPGVEVVDASAAGMKRIRIRGESSQRVTILVDGQEITDHSTFGTPILVDPANVERIEVIRGPASVLHGAKAIGGVVNIITRRGGDGPIGLEVGGTWYSGSNGWQGWSALSGSVGDFDYRLSVSGDDHNDRKVPKGQYTPTGRLDGTSYNNRDVSLHLGYTLGAERNHHIALKVNQHKLETDSWTSPSTLQYPITDFNISLPKRDLTKVGLYYDGENLSPLVRKVHVDAYYQKVDRLFSNTVTMQPLPIMSVGVNSTSDDRNVNYGGTAQVDLQFYPSHYTIAGVQYLMDDLDTAKNSTTSTTRSIPMQPPMKTVRYNPRRDRASLRTLSAFVQDEWSITDDFKLIGGLRYYHVKSSLDKSSQPIEAGRGGSTTDRLVKSLGMTYTGISNTTLRALYSEGYIMPTLLQMFTDTTAGSGSPTHGNPGLAPETSRNIEIGARYSGGGLVLDATAFYTKAKDYITTQPCVAGICPASAGAGDYGYVNANSADSFGLELLAEYAIPGSSFTPYASGAWMRREVNVGPLSTYNSATPALSGRLGLRYDDTWAGNDIWADLYMRGSTHSLQTVRSSAGVDSTDRLPGWASLNLSVGAESGRDTRQQFALHFNNILDKEYRASRDELPGTGRNVVLTYQVKF
ncbi:TonB-dependent receptor [Achromobacter sp. F4_2707]|uniref:TonB-dependent receptor plug domain-containing protein n=1 Tax=Achromobacter sp. F4_2707 TaxID=3114286 RepID=UPI0039C7269E